MLAVILQLFSPTRIPNKGGIEEQSSFWPFSRFVLKFRQKLRHFACKVNKFKIPMWIENIFHFNARLGTCFLLSNSWITFRTFNWWRRDDRKDSVSIKAFCSPLFFKLYINYIVTVYYSSSNSLLMTLYLSYSCRYRASHMDLSAGPFICVSIELSGR